LDGDRKIRLPLGRNQTQHFYGNVVVRERPALLFKDTFNFTEHSFGDTAYFHPDQIAANTNLETEGNVSFKVVYHDTPRRAVITFPQHRGFGGWKAPYSVFHGEKLGIEDCLYISFQEPYLTSGSYFLSDNEGKDPVPNALNIIRRELDKHALAEDNVTLIGASKGANIAAMISQHLNGNQLILGNYSMDLNYRLRNNFLSYLAQTLDLLEIGIPDALDILSQESTAKETHWLYSIGDDLANRGHETLRRPQLNTYACEAPHGEVLRRNWDFIKSLIERYHSAP
jgi:hypothetical protein